MFIKRKGLKRASHFYAQLFTSLSQILVRQLHFTPLKITNGDFSNRVNGFKMPYSNILRQKNG